MMVLILGGKDGSVIVVVGSSGARLFRRGALRLEVMSNVDVGSGIVSRSAMTLLPSMLLISLNTVASMLAFGSGACLRCGIWHLAVEIVVVVATILALSRVLVIVKMAFVTLVIVGRGRIVTVGCSVTRGTVVVLGGAVEVRVSLEMIVLFSIGVTVEDT